MNMVAMMIEEAKISYPMRMPFFFSKHLLRIMAKCAPRELYTCMLGHRLVGVSVRYRAATMRVKILSLGITVGRRCCPLGHRVDKIRKIVMPVKRKIQVG